MDARVFIFFCVVLAIGRACFSHGEPVAAPRVCAEFSGREKWHVHPSWRDGVDLKLGPDGAILTVAPTDKERHVPLVKRNFHLRTLKLHELFLVRKPSAAPARVRLRQLRVVSRCAPLAALDCSLEAGNEIHVIVDEGSSEAVLLISNAALTSVWVDVHVSVTDFHGKREEALHTVSVPAQGTARIRLPAMEDKGIFYVDYTLTNEDGATRTGRRSYAVMTPAGPTEGRAEGFLFGICTHTERWGPEEQRLEVLAAGLCGAKVIRTGGGWRACEPRDGKFDWSRLDRIVAMYAEQGMEIQRLLAFTPRWAAAPEKQQSTDWLEWNRTMPRVDAWRRFVRESAKRYGDRIRFWEVWNEPDIGFWRGTLDEYLVLLQTAYEEIKGVNPDLKVMTGGFAAYHRNPEFMDGVIDRGQQWFDIFAHHRHGTFPGFQREVDGPIAELRARLKPPKPIYFNETAVASIGIGERGQAETLVKKLAFSWARGAIGYTWYDLRNDGFDPSDYEHNYGMVTNDFYPKAVYPTYNTLVSQLRGKHFVKQLDLGRDRWAFVFADDHTHAVVAWNESPQAVDELYLLDTGPLRKSWLVDMMGNYWVNPPLTGGRGVLRVSRSPQISLFPGAKQLRYLGPWFQVTSVSPAIPGRSANVALVLRNASDTSESTTVSWVLPPELGGGNGKQDCVLQADAATRVMLEMPIPETVRGTYGTSYPVRLTIGVRDAEEPHSFDLPLPLAAFVAGNASEPTFELRAFEHVVSLFEADPGKKGLVWTGPADLSARVGLKATEDTFVFDAVVTDDVHRQTQTGPNVWKGDGIQLAMAVPGREGFWELGLTRLADGTDQVHVWHTPKGLPGAHQEAFSLATDPVSGGMRYTFEAPLNALGLNPDALRCGIRLSFLVNDDDGGGREGWVELSRGIGRSKDPNRFPYVVFE